MGIISVYCCTWNVGDEAPSQQSLAELLGVESDPRPDIIFLGLQEVVRSDEWYEALRNVMAPADYVLVKQRNCWAIWIYAFVKRHLLPAINNIESELTAFGYAGIMGNKGACSVRFEVCGVDMACVSAHFTPHTEKIDDRINDYRDVLKGQTFRDPEVNLLMDHDYVFWMGDLNFRTEGLKKDAVERLIASKNFKELLEYDQLIKVMKADLAFLDFEEGEINFPPTYKFDKGTKIYDSSKKQRVPSYTDRILYMAHSDFALEHNVQLDEMGRRIPLSTRKKAARGGPSDNVSGTSCKNDSGVLEETPELKLLAYDYLPEYVTSDHRPVFARFEARVPSSWFQLPIRFIQPPMSVHPVVKDLSFLYMVLDPPPLTTEGLAITRGRSRQLQQPHHHIRASSNDALIRHSTTISDDHSKPRKSPKSRPSANEAVTTNLDDVVDTKGEESNLLSVAARRLSVSCEALEMHPPAALRIHSGDWISVMPMGFYDIWRDYLTWDFCSTSSLSDSDEVLDQFVKGRMKRSDKMNILRERIPRSNFRANYSLLKGKVAANVLQRCRSGAIQLVYFSKFKNCPQGYSDIIKISVLSISLHSTSIEV
ncbi:hypothetical protein Aperf_G00000036056 [Anoplocephala perfoliata]